MLAVAALLCAAVALSDRPPQVIGEPLPLTHEDLVHAANDAAEATRAQHKRLRRQADDEYSAGAAPRQYLLPNLFVGGCYNPGSEEFSLEAFQTFALTSEVPRTWNEAGMKDAFSKLRRTRQTFKSCGQFNNILELLLHSLAIAKATRRTLVLPGFFFRRGVRRTRIDAFEEEWMPTSHFLNVSHLRAAGYHLIELEDFKKAEGSTHAVLMTRGLGGEPPATAFFDRLGIQFKNTRNVAFPFAFVQQSAPRWVQEDQGRSGKYTSWSLGEIERFWREKFQPPAAAHKVLAFDCAPSFGFGRDGLRFEPQLRELNRNIVFVDTVQERARRFIAQNMGDKPRYLAVHLRRGVDRLHEFCKSAEGRESYGWSVDTETVCYPDVEQVARKIKRALRFHKLSAVFVATDSPHPDVFETPLRELGVPFVSAAPDPEKRHSDPLALLVDQEICARATTFLGNFPSTVTVTILHMRDSRDISRERFDFFGSTGERRAFFRDAKSAPLALTVGPSKVHAAAPPKTRSRRSKRKEPRRRGEL